MYIYRIVFSTLYAHRLYLSRSHTHRRQKNKETTNFDTKMDGNCRKLCKWWWRRYHNSICIVLSNVLSLSLQVLFISYSMALCSLCHCCCCFDSLFLCFMAIANGNFDYIFHWQRSLSLASYDSNISSNSHTLFAEKFIWFYCPLIRGCFAFFFIVFSFLILFWF